MRDAMTEHNREAVLLNSGGIDSRVTAALLKKQGYVLHSLFVHLNKRNDKATIPAAEETARLYCADRFVFEYPVDWWMQKKRDWSGVPFTMASTHVIAAQYAHFLECSMIASGVRRENADPQRVEHLRRVLESAAMTNPITLLTPLYELADSQMDKTIDLTDTYSCNHYPPCGKCMACIRRGKLGLVWQ
jgi:7-cyano-7-deazaguanine synthase in queuosine biosynthesis